MPFASSWSEALQAGESTAFKQARYPHTPIHKHKLLVAQRSETYPEQLKGFFRVKPLYTGADWTVYELR